MLTAGTPKSLGQMFVSIEGRQRGEATELVNILSGDSAEIKVVKGLGNLQWEAAGAEQEIHCGTLPLFQEIVKYLCHGKGFSIGHVVLLYQHCKFLGGETILRQLTGGMGHRFKQRVSHPRRPPW